jgi:hypothetical protein
VASARRSATREVDVVRSLAWRIAGQTTAEPIASFTISKPPTGTEDAPKSQAEQSLWFAAGRRCDMHEVSHATVADDATNRSSTRLVANGAGSTVHGT